MSAEACEDHENNADFDLLEKRVQKIMIMLLTCFTIASGHQMSKIPMLKISTQPIVSGRM
jgi:hypothetical protein